ncbi:putaive DNA primase [Mycobacterium phage PP]|uniref:Putaive DNA primase n=1 Tax=Mycobacterium phage PP TaxID=2077134 RepID=A0A2Z5XVH8_9CAUD|nr:DNA primase [Mycobacterium phage PP]BBC53853.1 putaive DNA primase [Mycobacterium phage PP]
MSEPLIVRVIQRYYPGWEPPKDTGRDWLKCCCPFHGDTVASAGVSYSLNGFRCLACGVKGNAVTLIKQQEEVSFAEAERIAAGLSDGCGEPLPQKSSRKPSRRVFGDKGSDVSQRAGGSRPVPSRVRGRPTPWT